MIVSHLVTNHQSVTDTEAGVTIVNFLKSFPGSPQSLLEYQYDAAAYDGYDDGEYDGSQVSQSRSFGLSQTKYIYFFLCHA